MTTLYNRARVNTATAGTGTMTLGAATSNAFFTFAEAGVPDATVVSYVIEDGSDVEIGSGTYTVAGTTLSRTTVTASKIAGVAGTTKLTLSGSAIVYIDALARDIISTNGSSNFVVPLGYHMGIGGTPDLGGWGLGTTVLTVRSSTIAVTEYGTSAADAANNYVGFFDFTATANTLGPNEVAQLFARTKGTTANNRGATLSFATKADGSAAVPVVRMIIDHDGSISIIVSLTTQTLAVLGNTTAGGDITCAGSVIGELVQNLVQGVSIATPASSSVYASDYYEVSSGFALDLISDSILEIG